MVNNTFLFHYFSQILRVEYEFLEYQNLSILSRLIGRLSSEHKVGLTFPSQLS